MTTLSTFSDKGLDIGHNNANMTYLYGISDFFATMFEDTELVNALFECTSTTASEIYNKFLQLTSTLSIASIQQYSGKTLRLVIFNSSNLVPGEVNTYTIAEEVVSTRYIANRPFLPTVLLEGGIDYSITKLDSGLTQVQFSRDISNIGFPTRLLSDGATEEYAVWFVDSDLDEHWISQYFGNLIGLTPEDSTEVFKNFVYGLYYMYTHGPTLELLRKGLNLALGIPLSRGVETVLEIRQYPETDQYLVVTDMNQYLIPYGLVPDVSNGDVLSTSQELAKWVEIKDYNSDGQWWINLMIPSSIIPSLPGGQLNRYATAGSHYDFLMRTYLKTHTFLVNIKVTSFKNNQIFGQLSEIIRSVKPSYTEAIYVWSLETQTEEMDLLELVKTAIKIHKCEFLNVPIEKFYRNNSTDALTRDCAVFMRNSISFENAKLIGANTYIDGLPRLYSDYTANGFVNNVSQYRTNTEPERAQVRAVMTRNADTYRISRQLVNFSRGISSANDSDFSYAGVPVNWIYDYLQLPSSYRILPLYITTQIDLQNKCTGLGILTPGLKTWAFTILSPFDQSEAINSLPINERPRSDTTAVLQSNFSTLFFRSASTYYLGDMIPQTGYSTWAPSNPSSDILDGDFLIGVRIFDNILAIYWVTSNQVINCPMRIESNSEQLNMQVSMTLNRGMGPTSSPYYLHRASAVFDYNSNTVTSNLYNDTLNPVAQTMDRSGVTLIHRMELR